MTGRLARGLVSSFDIRHLLVIFPVPMNLLINLLLAVYVLVALLMVLVILMQRPKSEGLGAAFGGGVTENIFGAQTTNVLVKFTAWLAGIFFALTFALSILYAHKSTGDSAFRRELQQLQNPRQLHLQLPIPELAFRPPPVQHPRSQRLHLLHHRRASHSFYGRGLAISCSLPGCLLRSCKTRRYCHPLLD